MRNILMVLITCSLSFNFFCAAIPAFSQPVNVDTSVDENSADWGTEPLRDGAVIKLERQSGGFCVECPPRYTLTLFEDGKVVYSGIDFVKTRGKATGNIGKEKVKEIMAKIEKSGFFSISRDYIAIDRPVAALTANFNGKTKRIENSYGFDTDNKEAKKLMVLEDEIDALVQSAQWVK